MTTLQNEILDLAQGVPGTLRVLCDVATFHNDKFAAVVAGLRSMKITGCLVWVAYKDHCREDLEAFVNAVMDCDPAVQATVDRERAYL